MFLNSFVGCNGDYNDIDLRHQILCISYHNFKLIIIFNKNINVQNLKIW